MKLLLAFPILFLTGCSVLLDAENKYPCPYIAEELHFESALLEYAWAQEFYEEVVYQTDNVEIQCVEEVIQDRYAGISLDRNTIRFSTQLDGDVDLPIERTAFWHELIHIIRWRMADDPDAEHSGPWWELEGGLHSEDRLPPSVFNDSCSCAD